jgi:hypothetical protein
LAKHRNNTVHTYASENWTINRSHKRKIFEKWSLFLAAKCILIDENEIQMYCIFRVTKFNVTKGIERQKRKLVGTYFKNDNR